MDARSKLGFVLHRCCYQSVICTVTRIATLMEVLPFSTNISMVLESSLSYCLKKLPPRDRKTFCECYSQSIRKHSVSNDPDHLAILTQFLSSGGSNLIPQPDMLLRDLLDQTSIDGSLCRKPIALIIEFDPERMSPIFWNWYKESNQIEKGLSLLSEITIYAPHLQLPQKSAQNTTDNADDSSSADITDKECLTSQIVQFCNENINQSLPFCTIESCLLTARWLIRNRIYTPFNILPQYKHNALNSLSIECWAEYTYYGDLTKLPEFPETNDPTLLRGYLQIAAGAASNPKFAFESLHVPHWVWHACLREFGFSGTIQPKSILSLSLVELDCCIEMAHVLPSYFFIHAMRARSRNSDINVRLIKLVAQTPGSVLTTHIDDFVDFIDNILQYHQLARDLGASFRDSIVSLREHMPRIINHICSGLDYFDEDNMSGRLMLLNSLFVFTADLVPFIDIFDAIMEALSLIPLSLSLCRVLFDFFAAIAKFVDEDRQKELALMSVAALAAMFDVPKPTCIGKNQIAEKIYNNAKTFYSFVSSDIIVDPNYTIKDSFTLASPSLIILKQIKIPRDLVKTVLKMLTPLLDVCPVESTVVATTLIDKYSETCKQEYVQFNHALKNIIQHDSSTEMVMVVSYYQMKANCYFPLDLGTFLHATIFTLPDDVTLTRLNIQLDPGLAPMLVTKPEQLSLLLENWAPPTSDVFLAVVAKELCEKELSWMDEKYMRSFLRVFGYHEPKSREYESWLSREFVTQESKVPYIGIDTEELEENSLAEFSRAYPLPVANDPSKMPLTIAQMYGQSKKCAKFLTIYLSPIANDLLRKAPNAFWLMRLLGSLNIRYTFPPSVNDEYCRALGVRTKRIPPPDPTQVGDGFLAIETLSSYGMKDGENRKKLLGRLKSPFLAMKFPGKISQKFLKTLWGVEMSSTKRSYFIHLASFAEIQAQTSVFAKNEKAACELLKRSDLRDPVTFREVFLLIVTLVTQTCSTIDSSRICDTFLTALPKNVTDVQLYEALPVLTSITRIAGLQSKGTQNLAEALANPEFDEVSYEDFQSVRSRLSA